MKDIDKMSGSEFVQTMAELGEKHAKLISTALNTVAQEVTDHVSDDKLKDIHPVFVSAGKGAYHGALKIMMDKNTSNFKIVQFNHDP